MIWRSNLLLAQLPDPSFLSPPRIASLCLAPASTAARSPKGAILKRDVLLSCYRRVQTVIGRRPVDKMRHVAFAFTRNRERPSAIRRAWARALTAFTVRPRSAAMSMTEALEMMSSEVAHPGLRSRPSSCLFFSCDFLRSHARFSGSRPAVPIGIELIVNAAAQGKDLRNKRRSVRLPS
jgi:hypothetical protein